LVRHGVVRLHVPFIGAERRGAAREAAGRAAVVLSIEVVVS
jgi:hypothetical protein